jgi:uncharacterized caspase-like protein
MGDNETRSVRVVPDPDVGLLRRGRNVVAVIGIDAYQNWRTLHNAVGDAKGVRSLFIETLGFKELVPPLLNDEATKPAITSLLVDDLATRLEQDDSLVIFFAGHGHTESTQLGSNTHKTGYLIPVEGRLPSERKLSSWINLDTLLTDLSQLPARHVLLVLDSCYSGFALGNGVTSTRGSEHYTDDLTRRVSRRVITSAMDNELALDSGSKQGHSLFTGTLIDGIKEGHADPDVKGFITSSELAIYLQKRVGSSSGTKQTPDFGAFALDERGELVISLRGDTFDKAQARECLQVARSIHELGYLTDDPKRFSSAIREYRQALRLQHRAHDELPEAELGLGQALWASGDTAAAITSLSALIGRDPSQASTEAGFFLGLAHAKAGDPAAAYRALRDWVDRNPAHVDAGWAGAYADWLRHATGGASAGRKRALLVGINRYEMSVPALRGCVNDVERLMKPLLASWGVLAGDVVCLTDEEATRGRVLTELDTLARSSRPEDAVLVHFSGHSVPSSRPDAFGPNDREDVYLLVHDTHARQGFLSNGISAAELHKLIRAIPALTKSLVLDTHASESLLRLAEQDGTYALILASDTAEVAYEWSVEVGGEELPCGMLTGALYRTGMELPPNGVTYDRWVTPAIALSERASSDAALYPDPQIPVFVGQKEWGVIGGEDPFLPLFEFSQRRHWPRMGGAELLRRYRFCRRFLANTSHPQAHLAFGRALLEKGEYATAAEALSTADSQLGRDDPAVLLALVRALLADGRDTNAVEACRRLEAGAAEGDKAALADLLSQLKALGGRRHAVLVGIDRYGSNKLPALMGAVSDALAMQKVLIERWDFRPDDVTLLRDDQANRRSILTEFERLASLSRQETAVFYFAGLGSTDAERLPTIVSHDGRSQGVADITLRELAELAGRDAANLYVIIDAGFGARASDGQEPRTVGPDGRAGPEVGKLSSEGDRRRFNRELNIGALSILRAPQHW